MLRKLLATRVASPHSGFSQS